MSYHNPLQYMTQVQPNFFQWSDTQEHDFSSYSTSGAYTNNLPATTMMMAPQQDYYTSAPALFLETSVASSYSPRTPATPLSDYSSPHPVIIEQPLDAYYSPSPSSKHPLQNVCPYPDCTSKGQFKRSTDLKRHIKTQHEAASNMIDCSHKWCGRTGTNGFSRKDHLREHLREVHREKIPYKTARRESNGSRSVKRERNSVVIKTESRATSHQY